MAMPGRVYPEPAAAPGSLSMPGGVISGYNSNSELLTNAADNFTIELWVKPTEIHQIDIEGYWFNQYGGTSGQKYVIDPAHAMYFGNSTDESGAGVSVGTNGVSVYEHSGGYMPPMLVWQGNVTEWTHVAVVYENKTPRLYINGELVRTGVTSPKIHVYPGTLLASGSYGSMAGQVDEVRIWKVVRTQQQIQDGMYHSVSSPQPNLEAYWPIQPDETTTVADQSGNNHNVTLPTANYTSSSNTAPVGTDGYRYGFNGKENDNEVKGTGNQQDYGMRIYDPRIGKFLSEDPLRKSFPWTTPYAFAENDVIRCVDLDGQEKFYYWRFKDGTGKTVLSFDHAEDIIHRKLIWIPMPATIGNPFGVPMPVIVKEKNKWQEFIVLQEDEQFNINDGEGLSRTDIIEYDEQVSYSTIAKARNATDKDFEKTDQDIAVATDQAFIYGKEFFNKGIIKKASKLVSEIQWHHIIPKRLGQASTFVMKAIKGGFKIDGYSNLTPLERFIKKANTGRHAKHTRYTKQIYEYLRNLNINISDKEAADLLNQLNEYILKRIRQTNVKLNDLDLELQKFTPKS